MISEENNDVNDHQPTASPDLVCEEPQKTNSMVNMNDTTQEGSLCVETTESECQESATATFLSNAESSYVYSSEEEEEEYDDRKSLKGSTQSMPVALEITIGREREESSQDSDASSIISDGGHRFWSKQKAQRCMHDSIQEMSNLLCFPPEVAIVLLKKYKWDGKRLMDEYYFDTSQQDKIQADCGVLNRCCRVCTGLIQDADTAPTSSTKEQCCAICYNDELDADELFDMACGHEFCKICWKEYITEAIRSGQSCVSMRCPQHPSCNEIVTRIEVAKLAPEVLKDYDEYQFCSFVDTNWLMRWCPGPSCNRVVVGSPSAGLIGQGQCCECGTRCCLECGETRHDPATCDMMQSWNQSDDMQTADLLLLSTKKCPNCNVKITKNGGCSHMTCSQCQFHFCWLCMQDWNVHAYQRACNKFELDQAKTMEDPKRQDAERRAHCLERFQNHAQAQKFAEGELEKFRQIQEEKEKDDSSFDWNTLNKALGQLVECRRVLKYTYVVTYCLGDRPVQRELVEDHQALLERFTERLSEISEKDYRKIDRSELVNLTETVTRYAKNVMDCEIDEYNME